MGGRGASSDLSVGAEPRTASEAPRSRREKYKQFPDTPRGGYRFRGDGAEAEQWFAEHSNVKAITDEIVAAGLEWEWSTVWVPGDFMDGRHYRGWDSLDDGDKRSIQTYDDYLDKSVITAGMSVRRLSTAQMLGLGKGVPTLAQLKALEGSTIVATGHMSSAAAAEGLTISYSTDPRTAGKPIEYKFNIPAGTKGAGMWICDPRLNPSFGSDQREFMVNRDTQWRVGKTTYDSSRGVYVVELDWDGRRPHDYGTSGRVRPSRPRRRRR